MNDILHLYRFANINVLSMPLKKGFHSGSAMGSPSHPQQLPLPKKIWHKTLSHRFSNIKINPDNRLGMYM